jgi:hypothetical protein
VLPSVMAFATCVNELQLWRDRSLHTGSRFGIIPLRPQGILPRETGAVSGSKFNLRPKNLAADDLAVVRPAGK